MKHWHGAKKDSWFSHIAIEVPGKNISNEWCEPVTDEEYNKLGKFAFSFLVICKKKSCIIIMKKLKINL